MLTKQESLKLISSISVRGKRLDADIQSVCIASVYYSVCYGDVTIGQKLVENLHIGARKQAVVSFLEAFGQFEYKGKNVVYRPSANAFNIPAKEEGKFDEMHVSDCHENEELSEFYCAGIKVHWTAFKPEVIKSKFDDLDFAKSFIARMEKEVALGNVKHPELYDGMALAFNAFMEANEQQEEEAIKE